MEPGNDLMEAYIMSHTVVTFLKDTIWPMLTEISYRQYVPQVCLQQNLVKAFYTRL